MSQLTLPVLASLTPNDVGVKIVDENVEELKFESGYDAVCITSMTATAARAYEIAKKFRSLGTKIIMGGVHVSLSPDEAAKYSDAVVIGEAENVWRQVIEDLKNNHLRKIYNSTKKFTLENLPFPRHDLVDLTKYVNIPKVETSRGCPFNCNFCSTTLIFGNRMRYRPISDVINEIKSLKTKFVFFTDNNIVGNPKYAKEFFRQLIPLKIRWVSQGSLSIAKDLEMLKLAAKSGCVGMLIGFESLASDVIKTTGKKVNQVANYVDDIRRIHKQGIGIIGCFVFGFDEDDENVFKKTVKFVKKLNIDVPQFTILTPFPGTALREQLEKAGRILHNSWEKYDVMHAVFKPKKLSAEQLVEGYQWACKKIYSRWSIISRMLRSFSYLKSVKKVLALIQVNIVYRRLFHTSLDG
jgi:radical SAM superfamily enzyme YgiQ (UPF0313 family)